MLLAFTIAAFGQGALESVSVELPATVPHLAPAPGWRAVVGGEASSDGEWPDAAALIAATGQFGCTGTLIAPNLVLTAGHCAYGIEEVVVGTVDHAQGGERFGIVETHIMPEPYTTYDVAVMVLDGDSEVTPRPILRNEGLGALQPGVHVVIVGYGASDSWGTDFGTILREGHTEIVDPDCSEVERGCNEQVSPGGELIAGGEGIDSCDGDSGGPLYVETPDGFMLAGVTSRAAIPSSVRCGDGGIYVRADAVADWIEEVTGEELQEPDWSVVNAAPQPEDLFLSMVSGTRTVVEVDPGDADAGDQHTLELLDADGLSVVVEGLLVSVSVPMGGGGGTVLLRVHDDSEPSFHGDFALRVAVQSPQKGSESSGACAHVDVATPWSWLSRRR